MTFYDKESKFESFGMISSVFQHPCFKMHELD